ncbi:Uncharacterised protein [Legionella quateirensis]|uniref:Uncharacterized protein n=1 Tax=Legionella quateirensis TaxID=45072 RepID=A0A378KWU0_9GAMM|nr:Uncharacterised protein [Legionella quateirensis]STY18074.1 Uncharacterised protein [Legionella quateirensis]STY18075.1 Uncharacterised protein [Legionella quateirensis]STY18078.1 Uncharacterised protein [Legionella quateirensis]
MTTLRHNSSKLRHPECNEGSPQRGIVPAFGDPSLRSG